MFWFNFEFWEVTRQDVSFIRQHYPTVSSPNFNALIHKQTHKELMIKDTRLTEEQLLVNKTGELIYMYKKLHWRPKKLNLHNRYIKRYKTIVKKNAYLAFYAQYANKYKRLKTIHDDEYQSKLKKIYKNIYINNQREDKNFSEHLKMFREGFLVTSKMNLRYFLNAV